MRRMKSYLPSTWSSWFGVLPGLAVSDDCVEDDDELAHDGSDDNLEGLTAGAQAACEGFQHRVALNRDECGHVEASPHGRPSSLNVPWC